MVVRLEPAALGRVEVRLDFSHDNRVSALIAADRPETLEVLQRDSRALERSLQEAGLRLADNALSFSLRQEHRQRQGAAGEPAGGLRELPVDPLAQEDPRAAHWFLAERVLDIRI
jgi:flagellar hook-length control protein FliK